MKKFLLFSMVALAGLLATFAASASPPAGPATVENAIAAPVATPAFTWENRDPAPVWFEASPADVDRLPRPGKRSLLVAIFGTLFCLGMVNQRTLRDLNLSVSTALPAANANSTSASIDTASVNPGRIDDVELLIELPATPSLVDAHTVTLTVYDSADNVTFNAVADIPAQVVTGAGGVGAAAFSYQCKLPIGLRRYLALNRAVSNGGGDNTAISSKLSLVF